MISDLAELFIEILGDKGARRNVWVWVVLVAFIALVVLAFIYIPVDIMMWFI